MTYLIETYGCQVNDAERAAQKSIFAKRGWREVLNAADAALVLINSCAVRQTAEERFLGRLSHFAALKKERKKSSFPLKIACAGCAAQKLGSALFEKGADFALGTAPSSALEVLLENWENSAGNENADRRQSNFEISFLEGKDAFSFYENHHEQGSAKSFIPIMTGCNNFCSYCIVPYLRGAEISRSPDEILREIKSLFKENLREITFLGQNVVAYKYVDGKNAAFDFAALVSLTATAVKDSPVRWLRFLSAHPKDFSGAVLAALSANTAFCRHIHLPVQHGSNRILEAMNRRYTREDYLNLVKKLRAALPGVTLTTDILVGFPGETEDDVKELLSLMEEVCFTEAFMYHYNVREGTQAARLPGRIEEALKRERLSRVIETQTRLTAEYLKGRLGCRLTALVEGKARRGKGELLCSTEHGESVVIADNGENPGDFVELTLDELAGKTFRGHTTLSADFPPAKAFAS